MGSSSNCRNDGSRLLIFTAAISRCASVAIRDDTAVMPPEFADSGSTVAAYQPESFSVFLDKAEFKTRMEFIVDWSRAFQLSASFRILPLAKKMTSPTWLDGGQSEGRVGR
jgi:hypothetical protein